MGLFKKTKKIPGWMAICLQKDGICAAHIKRMPAALPTVEALAFYPADTESWPEQLGKLAKELRAERYRCTTTLAPNEYQLLSVEAPNVPADEIKTAIRWRLKDMLDFHIDDATIDVLDIPADKNAPVRNHSMYAVAARSELIQQRQDLFAAARAPLKVIDVPDLAQRNISTLAEVAGRGVALLSFDADGGLLTVSYSGELYLSRRIDVTSTQLLQSDGDQRTAHYDRITLELQRSLDHFDRQYHFITLSKLLLAPLGAAAGSLQDYLSTNLYMPIESLDLESVLDISRVPELKSPEAQQRYFMALGTALRHEEGVQ